MNRICLPTIRVPMTKNWAMMNWDTVNPCRIQAFLVLELLAKA